MAEIYMMLEKEFDIEISEDDCESFTTVNDVIENIARNFYSKWDKIFQKNNIFKILFNQKNEKK